MIETLVAIGLLLLLASRGRGESDMGNWIPATAEQWRTAREEARRQVDRALSHADEILRKYPWLATLGGPIPPRILAAIAYHESGGDPSATSRDPLLGETGLFQLTRDESREAGVADPLDPQQNAKGAVRLYSRFANTLAPAADAKGKIAVATWARSLGPRATRELLRRAGVDPSERQPHEKVRELYERAPAARKGRVTTEKFLVRVARGLEWGGR